MPETLLTRFLSHADRLGSAPIAWTHGRDGWTPVGWAAAARQMRELASGLMSLGQVPGDRLAILSQTRWRWALTDLGNLAAGGVTVGVYPTMTAEQAAYVVGHAEARFVVAEDRLQVEKIESVRDRLPGVEKIIVLDDAGVAPAPHRMSFAELLALGRAERRDVHARLAAIEPGHLATLIYTSGTTGPPKGAMLTHGNIVAALGMFEVIPVSGDDSGFSFLPLAHALQRMVNYKGVWHGLPGAFARSLETVADDLAACRPTLVAAVPRIFEKVHARVYEQAAGSPVRRRILDWAVDVGTEASRRRRDGRSPGAALAAQVALARRLVFDKLRARLGGRIRIFVTAGAPISREILEFFEAAGITILEGWGMTETTAAGTLNLPGASRIGSIGRPLPGIEMKLDDDGEILIRGPNVSAGYYRDEEATRASRTPDGFLRTGDVGRVDADGFWSIVDRKKDILITSTGKNIAPQNIENHVKTDPRISQVMVIGDRRPFVTALVTLTPEASAGRSPAEAEALVRSVVDARNADLASYERIRRFRVLPGDFTAEAGELTPTLKLRRKVILEKYAVLIESMYAEPRPGVKAE